MRSFTFTTTNRTVFGNVQDRVLVTAKGEGCAPAMPHLMSHDWRSKDASPVAVASKAIKRLLANAANAAARYLGIHPAIAEPQLCRLPVLSNRQRASVQS